MSTTDPIADMLTRIRNAQMIERSTVEMPSSKVKIAIAKLLKYEGYIAGFKLGGESAKPMLEIALRYHAGRPVIERIERVSWPMLRCITPPAMGLRLMIHAGADCRAGILYDVGLRVSPPPCPIGSPSCIVAISCVLPAFPHRRSLSRRRSVGHSPNHRPTGGGPLR